MGEAPARITLSPSVAVVADPDAGRLALTAATLAKSGFAVHTASDAGTLAVRLEQHHPAVVILDGSLTHSLARPGVPVLLMVHMTEEFDLQAVEAWGEADYIIKPPRAKELVHRVHTLIGRARERHRIRSGAEALRESLRNVSAAIRTTNNPQEIAEYLVNGFGGALGADRVWFATFRDDRVPRIKAQWHRPDLSPLPARLGVHEEAVTQVCNRLWADADVLAITDHHRAGPSSPLSPTLQRWAGLNRFRSSIVVPVGEGESALGVILIAQADSPREWTRTEIALIQHVAGNVAHGLIQGHLISAQQQVLQQLQQLDKAKTDFLATVNHELRTPLTSITAYLDMIREGAAGPVPEGIQKMVDVIARNSDRLRRLIEDMLTVSQQEGTGTLNLKRVDIGQVLQIVVATLRPLAESRDVSITFDEAVEDVKITADEAQLEQVFTNIVANAIKFTPDGGRISITSEPSAVVDSNPAVLVRVGDTGVGIPAHEIPQVFTRFYRASNASNAAVPGSGLGLAIAHDIVRRHAGQLSLTSTLGTGTTVSVTLPVNGP